MINPEGGSYSDTCSSYNLDEMSGSRIFEPRVIAALPYRLCESFMAMHRAPRGQSAKHFSSTAFVACLLLIFPARSFADVLLGRIVGVTDGDTVVLLDSARVSHKIRLAGIDAPEKGQPYSARSKENLARMIFGKQVSVEFSKHDKYGRIVGKALLDGADVDLKQIRDGLAWHYKKYEKEQSPSDRGEYADAERKAREQRTGLWEAKNPTPPWEYRKANRKNN